MVPPPFRRRILQITYPLIVPKVADPPFLPLGTIGHERSVGLSKGDSSDTFEVW
jgi:hypothetical protein